MNSNVNYMNQITEEKSPISYKPFYYDNKIFVVAQQNTRRIENIASFNFAILTPFGEAVQIDPAYHNLLFNIFMNQVGQYANSKNFTALQEILPLSNGFTDSSTMQFPPEKMDTTFHFTCSRSTSSTELSSQNIRRSSRQQSTRRCRKNIVVFEVDSSSEDCPKLNAREKLKQKKLRFDESFA